MTGLLNIVGGGYAGTVFAIHAMEQANPPEIIRLFEPANELGYGVAYSANHAAFRINVPCKVMKTFTTSQPEFSDWVDQGNAAEIDFRAVLPDGRRFYKRRLFGDYVHDIFKSARARFVGEVEQIHQCLDVLPTEGVTVLATGVGSLSKLAEPVSDKQHIIQNPYDLKALAGINKSASILIVGSGLTALDIATYLSNSDHLGPIEMISRSGQLPLVDSVKIAKEPEILPTVSSASAWLSTRRTFCENHQDPFAAFADVRRDLRENWFLYPEKMKLSLLRHGLGFWNIHRFRASPQTMGAWLRLAKRGQSVLNRRAYNALTETADVIINCTGPRPSNPFNLPTSPIGDKAGINIGLHLKQDLSVKGYHNLYALGADCRSVFADAYGATEIATQAKTLAQKLFS